jgi:putative restriction endonuclease
MGKGKSWTRDELIIAMNLYCQLPFGKMHQHNPLIIEIAEKMHRTPSSLAMKLTNFASLDPNLKARGIKGLAGASQADRTIWEEFHHNWEHMILHSEAVMESLQIKQYKNTEREVIITQRMGQNFFRRMILANYKYQCSLTGNPISELLVASHIIPWRTAPEHRLNPCNGICLNRLHDTAFDQGLISFDEDYCLMVSSYLKQSISNKSVFENFISYEGCRMTMPEKFYPHLDFLFYHRQNIFKK